jgi:hypothetical protein
MKAFTVTLMAAMLLGGAIGCTDSTVIEGGQPAAPKFALRINCAGEKEYVDAKGVKWLADQQLADDAKWGAVGGLTVDRGEMAIAGADAPRLYLTERYSMEAYQFALANGKYTVRLHFAETYEGITTAGERVFSVKINGEVKLKNLDVFKEAGGVAKPLVKECKDIAVTDGKLKIEFVANVQNPEINAIEILQY